jgi:hypothetical protein
MVNRRAFFEIFFYNRENRSREMMEAAEGVWRAYMKKYGLGLDAGNDGQPTYDEVREITYLANAAIEAVEKQMAEAEAEEARRKKIQKEAWDLGIFAPVDTATDELEAMVMRAMNKQAEPEEEETPAEPAQTVQEAEPEAAEVAEEAPVEEPVEEAAEEIPEAPVAAVVETVVKAEPVPVVQMPVRTAIQAAPSSDVSLWVQQLTCWCQSKGMQCIQSMDDGDCYLHVFMPHKKEVHTVGKWCFKKDTGLSELAAEITKLYAYCEGFADCFAQLTK